MWSVWISQNGGLMMANVHPARFYINVLCAIAVDLYLYSANKQLTCICVFLLTVSCQLARVQRTARRCWNAHCSPSSAWGRPYGRQWLVRGNNHFDQPLAVRSVSKTVSSMYIQTLWNESVSHDCPTWCMVILVFFHRFCNVRSNSEMDRGILLFILFIPERNMMV